MKISKYILAVVMLSLFFASCDKDGDMLYLSSPDGGVLKATATDVVLSNELKNTLVLSFAWTQSELQVSNDSMSAPKVLQTTLQASISKNFTGTVVGSSESSLSKAYTGSELNALAKSLGLMAGEATPVYFRLSVKTGNNMDPVYSNIEKVNITPYTIDMTVGYILDSKQAKTGITLCSPNADGVYKGFVGAASWFNFYLLEGNGTMWGNDGVDGTPFLCSSQSTQWKCWYPGQKGCYYTIMDTKNREWSALYIPKLSVSGDLKGDMTFDEDSDRWTYDFTAVQAGDVTFKISGTGAQYNVKTGTDDKSAVSTPVGFGGTSGNVTFGTSASDITVNVPKAGKYSLTLDLKNPKSWTCSVKTPDHSQGQINKYLYVSGADDAISGSWTFDHFLTLYNEDNQTYAGIMTVSSKYGYKFYTTKDDWDSSYGTDNSGTAASGSLKSGGCNIPAPEPGLYLLNVDMKKLTYNVATVSTVSVAGFNTSGDQGGNWTLVDMLPTAVSGVYSATVTLAGTCKWGAKIYINGSYDSYFGGSDGALVYKGDGLEASKGAGTYTLTVDLKNLTYTMK